MAKARAPGKVIICGEHAVVHGATALAAAIGIYTEVEITRADDGFLSVTLVNEDLNLKWPLKDIQSAVDRILHEPDPMAVRSCGKDLVASLKELISKWELPLHLKDGVPDGIVAFLFLYSSIVGLRKAGVVRIQSEIPMGCGLGSSAAYSVASAACLLSFTRRDTPLATAEWSSVCEADADLINKWAFEAEKIIHGTPSGIDNTVSSFGNIVKYKKNRETSVSEITLLHDLPSFRILVTNTRVLRNTKKLVANVGALKCRHEEVMHNVFEAIDSISNEVIDILQSMIQSKDVSELEEKLAEDFGINQGLLEIMGVSHPTIALICETTSKYKLTSKLTGAGGGGCVITFIPKAFPENVLEQVKADLTQAGFQCFEAELGVNGVQVLK